MKYVIVGSGPTGLSSAYVLAKNGYQVEVIEKDSQLGGSWNITWQENKYWSETAPRVMLTSGQFFNFLYDIGMTGDDFDNVYGNIITTNLKFATFFQKHFNFMDYFIFMQAALWFKIVSVELSLQDWMVNSSLSDGAKKAITIMCITINDIPKKTHVNNFFNMIGISSAKQMKEPEKWHKLVETKLREMPNVTIHKNTEVINLNGDQNSIEWVVGKNRKTSKVSLFKADKFILAIEPNAFPKLFRNASPTIKNNWNTWDWLQKWGEQSYYIGFGFQLHFRERHLEFPNNWCWSCDDDWNVIISPVNKWLKEQSRDPLVNSVWSCCITNMDTKSKHLGLTANQCSKEKIIEECMRQITKANPDLPKPHKITTSDGLYRLNNKWFSKNTGFTRLPNIGYLPMRGNLDNLFALGCYTDTGFPSISHAGSAVEAVTTYLNKYEPNVSGFHNKYHNHRILIMILFVMFMLKSQK